MSITTEITRLQNAKAALKGSIEAKGVTVASDATLDQYPALVDEIPQGGGEASRKDVNFYDYDGTILYSYTKQEFLALSEMPENPDHTNEYLVSAGWNWTMQKAIEYVSKYTYLEIGQMYTTQNNYCVASVYIPHDNTIFKIKTTKSINYIDWGDGYVETGISTSQKEHSYSTAGEYYIKIDSSGHDACFKNDDYQMSNLLTRIFIQSSADMSGTALFNASNGFGIKSVVYSKGLTTISLFSDSTGHSIYAHIIPDTVTAFSKIFDACDCSVISLPHSFQDASKLALRYADDARITFPKSITSTPSISANTSEGQPLFGGMFILPEECELQTIPYLYGFYIKEFKMPPSVTSFERITSNFLIKLYLSPLITNIPSYGLGNNYSLQELYVPIDTPPTVGSGGLSSIPKFCKIYVPSASVETYKAATGWSTYANQIFAMPE